MFEDYTIVKNAVLIYLFIIIFLIFLKPDLFRDEDKKKKAYFIAVFIAFFSFYFTMNQYT
jgi:bacteriorhodopsin